MRILHNPDEFKNEVNKKYTPTSIVKIAGKNFSLEAERKYNRLLTFFNLKLLCTNFFCWQEELFSGKRQITCVATKDETANICANLTSHQDTFKKLVRHARIHTQNAETFRQNAAVALQDDDELLNLIEELDTNSLKVLSSLAKDLRKVRNTIHELTPVDHVYFTAKLDDHGLNIQLKLNEYKPGKCLLAEDKVSLSAEAIVILIRKLEPLAIISKTI